MNTGLGDWHRTYFCVHHNAQIDCVPLSLVFLSRGLSLSETAFMGKLEANHVKFTLDAGAHKWPCVYWQAAGKAGRDFSDGDRVDAVFNITRDYFGGKARQQLVIIDVQRTGTNHV